MVILVNGCRNKEVNRYNVVDMKAVSYSDSSLFSKRNKSF